MVEGREGDVSGSVESSEGLEQKLIWLIDDNSEFGEGFLDVSSATPSSVAQFKYFQTGEEAVGKFQELLSAQGKLPNIILMDYALDLKIKNPKFKNGVEVINELKKIVLEQKAVLPEIISVSGENDTTVRLLLEAGASNSIAKTDLVKFIKSISQK